MADVVKNPILPIYLYNGIRRYPSKMNGNRFDDYNRLGMRARPEGVRVFDTTLRDGEQSPGIALSAEDKVEIALSLDGYGVDCIEAGFAISSEVDRVALRRLSCMGLHADVYSLARCVKGDIDAVEECGVRFIHLFIATSDSHLKYKLKMTREEVLVSIRESVSYAKGKEMTVMFSCEDATRTGYDYLRQAYAAAVEAGADIINVPDTVGVTTPGGMYELVRMLRRDFSVPISVHCHNDLGMAVANTLSSVEAGATIVHTCMNGIGERAGNASTEEVALNLKLIYGLDTVKLEQTERMSKTIVRYTGYHVSYNKPIVGRNAFAHESGIHVHGILNSSETYEPYPPETVGRSRDITIGRHSGEHSVREKLDSMGIPFPEELMPALMSDIKNLSSEERSLADIELAAIAENILWKGKTEEPVKLLEFVVITGKNVTPTATVTVDINGQRTTSAKTGNGPVDAAINAIRAAINNKIMFEELRLESITGGSDSLCEVTVLVKDVQDDDHISAGKAVGLDIVDTTVNAFMQAINRDYARSR